MKFFFKSYDKKQQKIVDDKIDYYMLTMKAIINAQEIIEDNKNKALEEKRQQEIKDWHDAISYKEYKGDNKFKKAKADIINSFSALRYVIFFNPKQATSDTFTFGLLQTVLSGIYGICYLLLTFLAIFLVFYSFITIEESTIVFEFKSSFLVYSIVSFLFSRFFRIACFEMVNLKDKNSLFSHFSATISFLAMIFALIALFHT